MFLAASVWEGNGSCHRKGLHKKGERGHYVAASSPARKQRSQEHHQTLPGNLIPYSETGQEMVAGPNPAGKVQDEKLLMCPEGKLLSLLQVTGL